MKKNLIEKMVKNKKFQVAQVLFLTKKIYNLFSINDFLAQNTFSYPL